MVKTIYDFTKLTERFAMEIIGLPIPDEPSRLSEMRKEWALHALSEELTEFSEAETLEDEADALLDLSYFALGRLVEMGLAPYAAFEEIHRANMDKKRGELSKRPGSLGFDAVKPEGWRAPDLTAILSADLDAIQNLQKLRSLMEATPIPEVMMPNLEMSHFPRKPKILILGHGRHGKDMVANMLAKDYGLRHTSSSRFCAERVVLPAVRQARRVLNLTTLPEYATAEECFQDRHNHRAFWFDAIKAYNEPDGSRLGREIFEEYDLYVGLRNKREFFALEARAVMDLVIWVDRSEHVPPESSDSCTVEPWMANLILDNNGTPEQTREHLQAIMENWLGGFEYD